jgi:hypothetical protein
MFPNTFLAAEAFADPAFSQLWSRADQPIVNNATNSSWFWGPYPWSSRYETYREATGGNRIVQYFDKGRMEINNPSGNRGDSWFVTGGLLCRELVSGKMQTGNTAYETREPANVPVAGDLDSPLGPTYATFNRLASLQNDRRAAAKSGYITEAIDRNGTISSHTSFPTRVRYSFYDNNLGHNIPDVFVRWMNELGSRGITWQFGLGYPITEPYWARFKIGGIEREVLVQLFERRALTFNPLNSPQWQVEMGNIGLHYYKWRYSNGAMPTNNPYGLGSEEIAVLDLINRYRRENGKQPLSLSPALIQVSRWMSQDMANKNYLGHTDSLGRDPFKRLADFGYPSNSYRGENLAAGFELAAGAIEGWKNSPGHNRNLLLNEFKYIGISRVFNPDTGYKWFWSTEFGSK